MALEKTTAARLPGGYDFFATTHWTVVLTAGRAETTRAQQALAQLCQAYWYPLYAYVRRRGYSSHDAEDLTQEFFVRLLQKNALASARRERGKFRAFLLASLNHFLADEWDRARAQKRGGDKVIPLDVAQAENRLAGELADRLTPEKIFERTWALTLLEKVYGRLRQEYDRGGKAALFAALKFCLTGERSAIPYAELANRLGLSEGAVKVAVHRLRERYRALLRAEIAQTVTAAGEIEEELHCLLRALAS